MNFIDFADDLNRLQVDFFEAVKNTPQILARFQGQFFVPGGVSRNKRYYPESLWENVLARDTTQLSLKDGMIGTLLHPENEKLSHPMYASHVVKRLWVDGQKRGMGEAYVLDTPVGRIVETFQKSGLVNLYVSSRAWGKYIEGKTFEGMPIVDENNYFFKTFDIVLEPGFMEANPSFKSTMEQLAECYLTNIGDINMPKIEKETRASKLIRDMDSILR